MTWRWSCLWISLVLHNKSPIICWISLKTLIAVSLVKIFRSNSINCPPIRFNFWKIVVRIPLNLPLPGFNKMVSHFSQAEHRVGEDIETVQWACRYPPYILDINQAFQRVFCLVTDQLFCVPEKLSCFLSQMTLSRPVWNACHSLFCSKSCIHEHSPSSQIHVQIFHRIVK